MTLFGAIEAGGTKFVLAVGDEKYKILQKKSVSTQTPEATLKETVAFFSQYELAAIGLGTFGPIDLEPTSATYGWITNTPKTAWKMFDLVGYLKKALAIPVVVTTDVNASCYGEYRFGVAKAMKSCLYYTVGTGVGAGAINQGEFVRGLSHPEMGHVVIQKNPLDTFEGICPYHGNCLEGMVSGPALEKRTGMLGQFVAADDPQWEFIADYLAQAAFNASLTLDPELIIFGGGVFKQGHLLTRIQEKFAQLNQGYKQIGEVTTYLQAASLNDNQGILGCLALALETVSIHH